MIIISPQNDSNITISTAAHREYYIQFCIENAKCAIFADLSYKGICESDNTFLQYMLTKDKVICIAFTALKWKLRKKKMDWTLQSLPKLVQYPIALLNVFVIGKIVIFPVFKGIGQ